ncbi:hypothetical protein [Scytonema sp. NUACC26]|uniref:hypothetical protein n=1 Tax=Scytonema sp. NUACC26 TaxID=3140176 RepID=UPI0034DC7D3A
MAIQNPRVKPRYQFVGIREQIYFLHVSRSEIKIVSDVEVVKNLFHFYQINKHVLNFTKYPQRGDEAYVLWMPTNNKEPLAILNKIPIIANEFFVAKVDTFKGIPDIRWEALQGFSWMQVAAKLDLLTIPDIHSLSIKVIL